MTGEWCIVNGSAVSRRKMAAGERDVERNRYDRKARDGVGGNDTVDWRDRDEIRLAASSFFLIGVATVSMTLQADY